MCSKNVLITWALVLEDDHKRDMKFGRTKHLANTFVIFTGFLCMSLVSIYVYRAFMASCIRSSKYSSGGINEKSLFASLIKPYL